MPQLASSVLVAENVINNLELSCYSSVSIHRQTNSQMNTGMHTLCLALLCTFCWYSSMLLFFAKYSSILKR